MTATKDQVAQIIVGEAKARNHTRDECLGEMSALYQESEWDETIWDSTHVTYGVAQQDGSYAHRFDGASAQVKAFFDKLDVKRASPGHGDIWLNICWLQQAPNWPSAQYWWEHGRQAYLAEIKSRIATVTPYLDKYWPNTGGTPVTDPRLTRLQAAAPDFNEYDVLVSKNFQDRNGTTVDLLLGHTEESSGYDDADGLAHWLETTTNTGNPVSYHRTISKGQNDAGVTVCNVVPIDEAAWAVGNSNNRSINTCFAGTSVKWTRQQWIDNCGRCFDVWAYLNVRDAITLGWTSIPVIPGPNYNRPPPGVSDHRYCTDYLKDGNNHTDMGDNVPWDLIQAAVVKYWAIATTGGTPVTNPPSPSGDPFADMLKNGTDRQVLNWIAAQLGPGDPSWPSKGMTVRDKLWSLVLAPKTVRKPKTP